MAVCGFVLALCLVTRWHGNRLVDTDISLEITMPTLPSGRRIEFSLDRFHILLERMGRHWACSIANNLNDPDDLLCVLDAVHFSLKDGAPYFAGYVATDWLTYAADWNTSDRQALQAWFASPEARGTRAEAIDYIKALVWDHGGRPVRYPYVIPGASHHGFVHEGSMLLQ